jgi:hypothetical protein
MRSCESCSLSASRDCSVATCVVCSSSCSLRAFVSCATRPQCQRGEYNINDDQARAHSRDLGAQRGERGIARRAVRLRQIAFAI